MFKESIITSSYIGESCRRYVHIQLKSGLRRHMTFSRYLMCCKLNRFLEKHEHVHHIDGNCMNDSIDNLEIVDCHNHNAIHKTKLPETFICPWCKISFVLEGRKLYRHKSNIKTKRNYIGPFCNTSHACKFTANKRWGNI